MLKKILKSLFGLFLGKKLLQPLFEGLFFFSLKGMNIGGGSFVSESGEMNVLKFVAKNFWTKQKSVVVFDVGANMGDYAKMAGHVLKTLELSPQIFAFEPSPVTFSHLNTALAGNSSVTTYNAGLGSSESTTILYSDETMSGMASLYLRDMSYFNIEFAHKEQVVITTLDKFCAENSVEKIDFLKLDIEGHELEALKGAEGMLEKDAVNFIQFEFGGADIDARVFLRDFVNLLKPKFAIYRILKDGLRRLHYSEYNEIFVTTNFLAVSKKFKDFTE